MDNKHEYNVAYVWIITVVAALGGLLFGYDTGVISGAIGLLEKRFALGSAMVGWTASCALIGCILGAAAAGPLSDRIGRRKILVLAAVLFFVSAMGTALPKTITQFILFRFIGGMGVGIASMTSPLYIAEISPPRVRGRLVSINQFTIVTGFLVVYFANYLIALGRPEPWLVETGWRWMFGSEGLPALLLLVTLFFVPESPRWLLKSGRETESRRILERINLDGARARQELSAIRNSIAQESGSLSQLFQPGLRTALFLGTALAILQQVTGINAVLYYAPEIFKNLGYGIEQSLLQTVIIGFVNVTFTLVAIWTVDRFGRKPLMTIGAGGMGVTLVLIAIAFILQQKGLFVLFLILAYIGSFAMSLGPVVWIVLSEIFPTRIRGRAMSIATVILWISCYLVSQTFPMMDKNPWLVEKFHHGFSFFVYAFFCIVTLFVVRKYLPETKGRSLEEIERSWVRTNE